MQITKHLFNFNVVLQRLQKLALSTEVASTSDDASGKKVTVSFSFIYFSFCSPLGVCNKLSKIYLII